MRLWSRNRLTRPTPRRPEDTAADVIPPDAAGRTAAGAALLYDASRIATRVLNATPNGIDRLDALLARSLLARSLLAPGDDRSASALVFGWGGPRILPAAAGLAALDRAERMWGEGAHDRPGGIALAAVRRRIAVPAPTDASAAPSDRIVEPRPRRIRAALDAFGRLGLRRGADPVRSAPRGSVVFNATHFPLDWPSHVAWLERRPDIRLVALIHDLLALDHPEFFWKGEPERHRARIALLARRGAGAVVTSAAVEARLRDAMAQAGRRDIAVLRVPPPVAPLFGQARRPAALLGDPPYFVACGTIEPRKNHALLLRVWRRLVAAGRSPVPRLVVVGKRGWLCDDVVAAMRDPALGGFVIEVAGLASADYAALLAGSCGLLAPSFAEGFGLPVAEALTTGVPVVASDIPPFREQGGAAALLLDPQADDAWLAAVTALSDRNGATRRAALDRVSAYRPVAEGDYVAAVTGFLTGLR